MVNGVVVVPDGFTAIPSHEGRYSIDADGRVFSHMRKRLMSLTPTNTGYLSVGICADGAGQKTLVQYLMVKTFIPDFPEGAWVDHENRIRSDNRSSNLRPSTRQEQNQNKGSVKLTNNTKFRGVILKNKNSKCWVAIARRPSGKKQWSRYCTTDREAAGEYDKMAIEFHGKFAITNASLGLL